MGPSHECAPGSEASLFALYELVPAAEHEDLAEEARSDRWLREMRALYADILVPDDGLWSDAAPPHEEPDDPTEDEAPVLSEAALIAMLEHRLGARPVDE